MERTNRLLSLLECKAIVDDFSSLIKRWNCRGRILFTGGDPLLYPYFFELLDYTRRTIPELTIGILGNPELLTEEIVQKLKDNSLYSYQLSIDGLEKTHDYFRYEGSFRVTLEKIKLLKQAKIKTVVMTTVSNANLREIPKIIDLVVENKVDLFGFHRLVPIGNGKVMKNELVSSVDYRWLLSKVDEKCQSFADSGTIFGGGEPLWKLLHFEKGIMPKQKFGGKKLIWGGCSIGFNT
jgi:MoaA/NifB/PqqE/SkfB family radical SAM enzyme